MDKVFSMRLPENVIEWLNETSSLCKKSASSFAKDIIMSSYTAVIDEVMTAVYELSIKNEELIEENKRMELRLKALDGKISQAVDYTPETNTITQSNKISRNAPCPCGSGKKYKKCCGFDTA